jgi:hypothetical protein
MSGPFKMKGFPAQAGVSPVTKKTDPKKLTADSVSGLEGAGKKGAEELFVDLDETEQNVKLQNTSNPKKALTEKYGGTWTMGIQKTPYNTSTGTKYEERKMWLNQDGLSASEVGNQAATDRTNALED